MKMPGLAKPIEVNRKGEIEAVFPLSPTRALVSCNDGETGTAVTR